MSRACRSISRDRHSVRCADKEDAVRYDESSPESMAFAFGPECDGPGTSPGQLVCG
jgi:hypothetical protein